MVFEKDFCMNMMVYVNLGVCLEFMNGIFDIFLFECCSSVDVVWLKFLVCFCKVIFFLKFVELGLE